ncbi:proteasome activator complex subunit 4-like [Haemaphysalis longicornis]
MSSDERSDKDRFNFDTFFMFKGLFRNYGSAFLPHFEKVLRYKISSNEAGNQRYALEILTGLMRGSKHWGFEKMLKLRTTLEPILRLGLPKILPETLADWGTCVAGISEHRDPNKYQWFFQLLLEEPNGTEAVADRFLQASHLRLRLAAIAQQQWRVCEILEDELERLKQGLANDHPDVREKISGLLRRIFMYDVHLPMFEDALSLVPRASRFMEYLLPLLAPLTVDDNQAPKEDLRTPIREGLGSGEGHAPPSRKAAANVLKTVCRWILATIAYSPITDFSEFFKLVPVLCHVQSYDTDAEVQRECAITLDSLGDALLPLDAIPQVLGTIIQVMGSPVWQARASSCNLLRSLVDANLFLVSGSSKWRNLVVQHTLALLKDDHLEVRESAAETLTHLFLGGLLEVTDELVALFRDQCLSKANGGSADVPGPQEPGELVERHAGILGLCACINAYPLDLPAFLRDVMAMLEERPEDPPFISTTIKKGISDFHRNHQLRRSTGRHLPATS